MRQVKPVLAKRLPYEERTEYTRGRPTTGCQNGRWVRFGFHGFEACSGWIFFSHGWNTDQGGFLLI